MNRNFICPLFFTTSIIFFNSQSYALGEQNENLVVHPPVKHSLSASEPLSSASHSVSAPLSQSAPVVIQGPKPWTNEPEKLVFLHVHHAIQLKDYEKFIQARDDLVDGRKGAWLESCKTMKRILSKTPFSSLTQSQTAALELLMKNQSRYMAYEIKQAGYVKAVEDCIELAEFDEQRVKWHQKKLNEVSKSRNKRFVLSCYYHSGKLG